MKIRSDNPPRTVCGMWDAICDYAETDELTKSILITARNEDMDAQSTLVCLAYAALCAREMSNDTQGGN